MNDLWRREAIARFPSHAAELREVETPYQLWGDLWLLFERAYESGDASFVADVYAFAKWCGTQPRGQTAADDLPTCVNVCFVEHIPTHPKALRDMPRWFTLAQVTELKDTLSYLVGPEGYSEILKLYAA